MDNDEALKRSLKFLKKDTNSLYNLMNCWYACIHSDNENAKELATKLYNKISSKYKYAYDIRRDYNVDFEEYMERFEIFDGLRSGLTLIAIVEFIRFFLSLINSKPNLIMFLIMSISTIIVISTMTFLEEYRKHIKYPYRGTDIPNDDEISPEMLIKIIQGDSRRNLQ